MFPFMAMAQIQGEMIRQMTQANAQMFYLSTALPIQIMRSMAPIGFMAPVSRGRACMPFRF